MVRTGTGAARGPVVVLYGGKGGFFSRYLEIVAHVFFVM